MSELVANAIIPTGFKSKIPHTLSYPTGAEALSRVFAGIPQFSELTLDFWFWAKVRHETATASYSVLELGYRRAGKSIHTRDQDVEKGLLSRKWTIVVKPVPRSRRHLIKTQLEDELLPFAREWLVRNAGHDEIGALGLTLTFSEEKEMLIASESSALEPRRV